MSRKISIKDSTYTELLDFWVDNSLRLKREFGCDNFDEMCDMILSKFIEDIFSRNEKVKVLK